MVTTNRYLTVTARPALALCTLIALSLLAAARAGEPLHVDGGAIADTSFDANHVRNFKGIPFAAPPVGDLRWREPQPVKPWQGERSADQFGPRCMQTPRLGAIDPLNPRMSEDCLYLNVWTPANAVSDKLPVMVWIYGGSFNVGSGSEPWYNGANLAKKGVVVVTLNYRLDVFGFLAHPDLTTESEHRASGNYGLQDQLAALAWVKRNIAAFGGDADRVTVFGESAGSLSVSALMASPLGRGLFARAVGESGAMLYPDKSPYARPTLAKAEQAGVKFAELLSARSIAELRAKLAEDVLDAVAKNAATVSAVRGPIVDGYVLPSNAAELFAKGQQNDVPLLAGSNADEGTLFANRVQPQPTPEIFIDQVRTFFGSQAETVLKVYPADTPEQTKASFAALLGDQLISYPTWLWDTLQAKTSKAPNYRYSFELRPPAPEASLTPLAAQGVFHSAEILYVFDNLQVREWNWRPEDRKMAELLSSYWVNFAKNGDPNAPGLPEWPKYTGPNGSVMRLSVQPSAGPDPHLDRYLMLNTFYFETRH
jgi:para-nitrobenzyl esterase